MKPFALELCSGGGGQALGLEQAGFECAAAVEIDAQCCATLRYNRPHWNVIQDDLRTIRGRDYRGVDLIAAGVPCPPFSIAGKQLGDKDERDLFPEALRLIDEVRPPAILLENVPGFSQSKFSHYRRTLLARLSQLGYEVEWRVLNACEYGVPQLRPRFVLVGLRATYWEFFNWPEPSGKNRTVGEVLQDLMGANGWSKASLWAERADRIAPTIVGGSKKHGGPDLGPTRAKQQWRLLGVDPMGVADAAPEKDFPSEASPKLTVRMVARLQSFPDKWAFTGRKTPAYRQVGNAFPPLVAKAVGNSLLSALKRIPLDSYSSHSHQTMRLFEYHSAYINKCHPRRARSN